MPRNLTSAFEPRQYMLSKDFEIFYYSDLHFSTLESHVHDYYEFYFFLGGRVSMELGDETTALTPGDIIIVPPGQPHRAVIHDPAVTYQRIVFWISEDFCRSLEALSESYIYLIRETLAGKGFIYHVDDVDFNALKAQVYTLLAEIRTDRFGREARIPNLAAELILSLNRMVYEKSHVGIKNEARSLCEAIASYIDTHFDEDLTLDTLAARFYVSKYYISHLFQDELGLSVHRYLTKRRLAVTRDAILSGASVGEAYSLCGFKDYTSFYRAFLKEYGVSPKQYRLLYADVTADGH